MRPGIAVAPFEPAIDSWGLHQQYLAKLTATEGKTSSKR